MKLITMSTETAKKRKIDGRADEEGSGGGMVAAAAMEKIMVEMKAQMERAMESRLADMKNDMMNEMKSRSTSMHSEMDAMKRRLSRVDELESKCQFLEARCGSLQRSVQILIEDTKWKYSAPSIPTSHWIDRGFDEDYIEWMELFLEGIKSSTHALRNGTCDNIELGGVTDEGDDTVLLYDDSLLPHWKEFANALQLSQKSEANLHLSIDNIQLTSSVMDLLTSALKDKPISDFHLGTNEFEPTINFGRPSCFP